MRQELNQRMISVGFLFLTLLFLAGCQDATVSVLLQNAILKGKNPISATSDVGCVSLGSRTAVDKCHPLLDQLPNLWKLHIGGVRLSEEELEVISGLAVKELNLPECKLNNDDLEYIGGMTGLKMLGLSSNSFDDEGLSHLGRLTDLEDLTLFHAKRVSLNLDLCSIKSF